MVFTAVFNCCRISSKMLVLNIPSHTWISLTKKGNDDRSSRETLSVNRDYSVADFDPNNGFDSWNSVWDHNTGFGATRVLRKNSCLINKIDRISPSIVLVPPPPPGDEYHFIVPRNRVQDLSRFGKSIQALCRGIPAYLTYPASGEYACD
uniref:BRICHOS domain-containing protein n=1 Tax=Dromaius novaehollandiae TaxID=8790 RepID=A0A8C4JLZ6_DRONO